MANYEIKISSYTGRNRAYTDTYDSYRRHEADWLATHQEVILWVLNHVSELPIMVICREMSLNAYDTDGDYYSHSVTLHYGLDTNSVLDIKLGYREYTVSMADAIGWFREIESTMGIRVMGLSPYAMISTIEKALKLKAFW